MFFSKKLNSLINRPHEKAFRTVYQDHDASFTKLLEKNISTGMHNRIIQLFAIGLFNAKNELSPSFMNDIFVQNAKHYNLGKKAEFNPTKAGRGGATSTPTFFEDAYLSND